MIQATTIPYYYPYGIYLTVSLKGVTRGDIYVFCNRLISYCSIDLNSVYILLNFCNI